MFEDFIIERFGSGPLYLPLYLSDDLVDIIGKTYSNLIREEYNTVVVAISGGADSDIVIDLIERCKTRDNIRYVFFNTGLEYDATIRHLDYLENLYNVKILRVRPKYPVPIAIKKFGVPFRNKRIANYIGRLQAHNFKFEDKSFKTLYKEYPECKAALRWWCNDFGGRFDISYTKGLKEFMIENPPSFKISDRCCTEVKKNTAHKILKDLNADLNCYGVRKSEGGVRATSYKGCFTLKEKGVDEFRPIFNMTNELKECYEILYDIKHSDCYGCYGLKRTGCAGCPFGRNYKKELEIIKEFEPNLYVACLHVFGQAYDYDNNFELFRS